MISNQASGPFVVSRPQGYAEAREIRIQMLEHDWDSLKGRLVKCLMGRPEERRRLRCLETALSLSGWASVPPHVGAHRAGCRACGGVRALSFSPGGWQ